MRLKPNIIEDFVLYDSISMVLEKIYFDGLTFNPFWKKFIQSQKKRDLRKKDLISIL